MAELATKHETIFEKLSNVQSELKAPKNQYNSYGKYKYRSCEDIIEAAKPLLHAAGLVLIMNDEIVYIEGRFYLKATARIIDVETEASLETCAFAREAESKTGSDLAQLTGACSSYARKYALNAMFAVDDTKDTDSNEAAAESQTRAKKATKKAAAAPEAQAPAIAQEIAQEIPTESEPKYSAFCARCKNPINGTDRFTAEQIIANANRLLGASYCFPCGQKVAAELKAKKEKGE